MVRWRSGGGRVVLSHHGGGHTNPHSAARTNDAFLKKEVQEHLLINHMVRVALRLQGIQMVDDEDQVKVRGSETAKVARGSNAWAVLRTRTLKCSNIALATAS